MKGLLVSFLFYILANNTIAQAPKAPDVSRLLVAIDLAQVGNLIGPPLMISSEFFINKHISLVPEIGLFPTLNNDPMRNIRTWQIQSRNSWPLKKPRSSEQTREVWNWIVFLFDAIIWKVVPTMWGWKDYIYEKVTLHNSVDIAYRPIDGAIRQQCLYRTKAINTARFNANF